MELSLQGNSLNCGELMRMIGTYALYLMEGNSPRVEHSVANCSAILSNNPGLIKNHIKFSSKIVSKMRTYHLNKSLICLVLCPKYRPIIVNKIIFIESFQTSYFAFICCKGNIDFYQ